MEGALQRKNCTWECTCFVCKIIDHAKLTGMMKLASYLRSNKVRTMKNST